jgi:hypothetical protein
MILDREQAQRLLDAVPVRYIVVDHLEYPGISERYGEPTVRNNPRLWRRVYQTADGLAQVYERVSARPGPER